MATVYPLCWPTGMPRTKYSTGSRFSTSVSAALKNVADELRRFGADTGKPVTNILISSNVTLGTQSPKDSGIAVYFRWEMMDCCIAIDKYTKPEDNLQAVAKIIEADRAKMRHGGLHIVRASFRGYVALPPPTVNGQLKEPWWQTLGLPDEHAVADVVEARYRELVKQYHPDRGGDAAVFHQIVEAMREARSKEAP